MMADIWEKTISILAENLNSGRNYFITAVPGPHSYIKYFTYSHHLHPLLNTRGRNFKDFTKKKCLPKSGLKKYKPCYSQVPNKKVGLFFWANYLALLVYLAPESIMARVRQSNMSSIKPQRHFGRYILITIKWYVPPKTSLIHASLKR